MVLSKYLYYLCDNKHIFTVNKCSKTHLKLFVKSSIPENYYIRAGSKQHNFDGIKIQIQNIVSHPKFHRKNHVPYNDILLLQLQTPLKFNKFIQPVFLPEQNLTPKEGTPALVAGWGTLNNGGDNEPLSENLLAAKVYVINQNECRKVYDLLGVNLSEGMICAGTARSKRGIY